MINACTQVACGLVSGFISDDANECNDKDDMFEILKKKPAGFHYICKLSALVL